MWDAGFMYGSLMGSELCWNIWVYPGIFMSAWPVILESAITLVHPYSRNKYDKEGYLFFFYSFLFRFIIGLSREVSVKQTCLCLYLSHNIKLFQLKKNSLQNKSRTKPNLWSQTYSCTKFIQLYSIIVFKMIFWTLH